MTKIIKLDKSDLNRIMVVEQTAFLPSIQTTQEVIRRRLNHKHIYLGAEVEGKLVGTLALRFAHFIPDFEDFRRRNPTFKVYAESPNDTDANAIFVYSIGVMPHYRDGINAGCLLREASNIGEKRGLDFLVGDARIPSYNGGENFPYERFVRNEKFHEAVDEYFKTGTLPDRELVEKDPVIGFYLKVFPDGQILGITDETFWKGDDPCGGHMMIGYKKLK